MKAGWQLGKRCFLGVCVFDVLLFFIFVLYYSCFVFFNVFCFVLVFVFFLAGLMVFLVFDAGFYWRLVFQWFLRGLLVVFRATSIQKDHRILKHKRFRIQETPTP